MRKLPKPTLIAGDVFRNCVSVVRDLDLKRRLESVCTDIESASGAYDAAATAATLHTILPHSDVRGIVTTGEMSSVYSSRMVPRSSPGRPIYDALIGLPAQGRCPLCGQRVVSTLDHHLPKSRYPNLAVAPINLVPACADCNREKGEAFPSSAEQQTLHPYYDDVESDTWLRGDVIAGVPPALKFSVIPPASWDSVKAARLRHHFQILKLASLYASHAAEELMNIQRRIIRLFENGGACDVKDHLLEEALSRRSICLNSWQTAMYACFQKAIGTAMADFASSQKQFDEIDFNSI